MMEDAVLLERHGAVALLTMNLGAKRNALAPELYSSSPGTSRRYRSVRARVLTGGVHFCGLDTNPQTMRNDVRQGHRVIREIICSRLPVVAAVQGAAFGAGLSLASVCDFVIADKTAQLGAGYGKVGVMPDWACSGPCPGGSA